MPAPVRDLLDSLVLRALRHADLVWLALAAAAFAAAGPGAVLGLLGVTLAGLFATARGRIALAAYAAMRRRPLRWRGARIPVGVTAPVEVRFDRHALPTITAGTETDAWRGAGVVLASERMFQMDMLRRRAGGRLAELLGPAALESDLSVHRFGIPHAAGVLLRDLPERDRARLEGFADGVNACLSHPDAPRAFEYRALRARPEPWRPEDSVAVLLGLHLELSDGPEAARMRQVAAQTLPPALAGVVAGGGPLSDAALDDLAALARDRPPGAPAAPVGPAPGGGASHAAAIPGSLMADGRPALCNDLHLPLAMPGTVAALRLVLPERTVTGAVVPGIPAVVAGTNGRVAWGIASLAARTMQAEPRTPGAEARRVVRTVEVRGGAPVEAELWLDGGWPVPRGKDGDWRLRWHALRPGGADLGLAELAAARDAGDLLRRAADAAAPPLEVVAIDRDGRTGHGVAGPAQDGQQPNAAASGLHVVANGPHPLSVNPSHPARGATLRASLSAAAPLSPEDLDRVQRGLATPVLAEWHRLALSVAGAAALAPAERALLDGWSATAAPEDRATAWIAAFAAEATRQTLGPLFWPCVQRDPGFELCLNDPDTLALAVLRARPEAVADGDADRTAVLTRALVRAGDGLRRDAGRRDLSWWRVNAPRPAHPLSDALPPLRAALRWPRRPVPGAADSVWTTAPDRGIAFRLVVTGGPDGACRYLAPPGLSGWPFDPAALSLLAPWQAGGSAPAPADPTATGFTLTPRDPTGAAERRA